MVHSKNKGHNFERELAKYLNKRILQGEFKRVPGSGSMGTALGEPILMGDVNGKVQGLERTLKIDSKVGYGGAKQLTFKKEWLDKIAMEAATSRSIPLVVGRFSNSRSGVENFVVMDLEVFCDLLNYITSIFNELEGKYEQQESNALETRRIVIP